MDAVSYSDLRQNLKSYMDKVYTDHDPLIITRKNNENLVLLSIEEYSSLIKSSLSDRRSGEMQSTCGSRCSSMKGGRPRRERAIER